MATSDLTLMQIIVLGVLLVANFPIVMLVERRATRPGVRRVYDLPIVPGQRLREMRTALTTTPVHALVFAGFLMSGYWQPTETGISFVISFFVTLVWTEIWNYATHVAYHTRYLFFIHRTHHLSAVTNPWSSTSFSALEKFIFAFGIVGLMATASRHLAVSFYGVAAFYVVYYYLTALGHANCEPRQPGYARTRFGALINTPTFHALHHARFDRNFGLLSPILDRLFGTEWVDSPAVQSRAAAGQPLKSLTEQIVAAQ